MRIAPPLSFRSRGGGLLLLDPLQVRSLALLERGHELSLAGQVPHNAKGKGHQVSAAQGVLLGPLLPLLLLLLNDSAHLVDRRGARVHERLHRRDLPCREVLEAGDVRGSVVVIDFVHELHILPARDEADVSTLAQVPFPLNALLSFPTLVGNDCHEVEAELDGFRLPSGGGCLLRVGLDAALHLLASLVRPEAAGRHVTNEDRARFQAIKLVDLALMADIADEVKGILTLGVLLLDDVKGGLVAEGVVRLPNGFAVAHRKAFHLGVEVRCELLEFLQVRAEIQLVRSNVHEHGENGLRCASILDHLLRKEEPVVCCLYCGPVIGLALPLEEKDETEDLLGL
mmetsp:Transcript_67141/g.143666  ORF Transcript_67141/g.143666 Transcript_67141/m.143666 type:complete len:342 (-) Transcript_67141:205-1230(-)